MSISGKKIRFFNTYEPASPVYKDLIPLLVENGYICELIASKGEYRMGRNLEALPHKYSNVTVVRTMNLGFHAYKSTVQKAIVAILFYFSTLRIVLFGKKTDLDVYFTQPPLINTIGMFARRIKGQAYSCIVMDLYPQEGFVIAGWNEKKPFSRLLLWLSKLGYKYSESNVAIGRCMQDRLKEFGIRSDKTEFIPNWIDEMDVQPSSRESNELLERLGLLDKFVVFYGGNIGNAQHYDDILKVANLLKEDERIHFLFVGSGTVEGKIDQCISKNNLQNVTRIPLQHQSYSLEVLLGASNIHFISLKNSLTGLGVPSKAYATLAAGKPILYQGSAEGEIARVVAEEGIGRVVEIGDVSGLKSAVEYLFENRDTKTLEMGALARTLAETKFSKEKTTGAFFDSIVRTI